MDERIHCCFYFIASHRFKSIDREFILKICDIVPIVPVIAKADQMTVEERAAFLEEVQTELGKIAELKGTSLGELMYDFKEEENSAATAAAAAAAETAATTPTPPVSNGPKIASKLAQALTTEHKPAPPAPVAAKKLPTIPNVFAVVCDTRYERAYPWGTCEIRNEEHSDFLRLQYLIFEAGNIVNPEGDDYVRHFLYVNVIHFASSPLVMHEFCCIKWNNEYI